MAPKKNKKWQQEQAESHAPVTTESPAPESPAKPMTLEEAKAIVNAAVQPPVPGQQTERPSPEMLAKAKALVSAAVQPPTPQ